jgi:cytochrome c oxidase assembly protein subunit 15
VFCLTTTIALATSPGWRAGYTRRGPAPNDATLQRVAKFSLAVVYLQIVVGATMRHTDAGLAIPDFPWMFGHLVPDHWDPKIAVHFAHRVGALCVVLMLLATTGHVLAHHRRRLELLRPSILLLVLVSVQVTLGALTILSRKEYVINSLHVVTGGCVLITTLVLTLRAHRARFADAHATAGDEAGAPLTAGPGHPGAAAGARA